MKPGWATPRRRCRCAVGAARDQRVVSRSGTKTVPPPLTVWSRPWSKNWPKNVKSELKGGEKPLSVLMLGIGNVWWVGCIRPAPPDRRVRQRVGIGRARHVVRCSRLGAHREPRRRHRSRVVAVWSTIRLLTTRGWESKTFPVFWEYDEIGTAGLPGPKKPAGTPSARRNVGMGGAGRAGPRRERRTAGEQVVARAVDGPQPVGAEPVGDLVRPGADQGPARVLGRQGRGVVLGDLDLLQDEREVGGRDREALTHRRRTGGACGVRRERGQPDGQETRGDGGDDAPGGGSVVALHRDGLADGWKK